MSKNTACCNNPTLAYRSDNDQRVIKQYCPYALKAPTDFYRDYNLKEFYCAGGCGDSMPSQYYASSAAYEFHPGTMAQGGANAMCGKKQ